uniref:RGS domain-containing protein n=1 Tax=Astatotilapia calliptera TaxID=8154 RepID=A0AAX7W181_ASTCA
MDSASLCSRKRPCDGAVLHLHQEAQQPFRKRGEGRRGDCKENRDPRDNLQRKRRDRRGAQTTNQFTPTSVFRCGSEIQIRRAEIRVALIRKTRIQTGSSGLDPVQGLTEPQRDQQPAQSTWVRTLSEVRPGSMGSIPETRTRRRKKVQPSAFRGRGQLRLSVTRELQQLIIHIHEARGLMGQSQRSCDSYVKLALTYDLQRSIRIKTDTVYNNKNPKYECRFKLWIRGEFMPSRLLVSVFRRPADNRRSQLIGCMSFRIGSLVSSCEPLNGWFYLLAEEYGWSKHLRVTSHRSKPTRSSEEACVDIRADLRRTPDSTPDSDLNHIVDAASSTGASTASLTKSTSTSATSTSGPKDLISSLHSEVTSYSSHASTLYTNTSQQYAGRDGSAMQRMELLQPVYHDRTGSIGHLYQTRPRGPNVLHDSCLGSLQRPFTRQISTLPPPLSSTSSALPRNYGNYQNCTIVQSHVPCSGYGTYVTMAPKTVIFPIFVQPLDLCSPDRALLMSEEMILHQADLLPAKVTVLIYTDLLLLTREDEAGRCNVLQSPVFLNTLKLREALSEPLHLYFLQSAPSRRRLFSLEAFSIEQKVRVSLCLHDNIQPQLVTTEATHTQQLSDLPSDFGFLSLGQSDPLYCPSSPYSSLCDSLRPPSPSSYSPSAPFSSSTLPPAPVSLLSPYSSSPPSRNIISSAQLLPSPHRPSSTLRSPIWKERAGAEEEEERRKRRREEEEVEERQQGEGESASETSENAGGVGGRGFLLSPHHFNMNQESDRDEEEEKFIFRPPVLRRSLSEGSLLREPRSPHFLSDSTIHRLTRPVNFDLSPNSSPTSRAPSPHTLRKQLTGEGGSLHQMLMLLNGTKAGEPRNRQLKKKTLAADVRSRLAFLRMWKNGAGVHGSSLEKALKNNRPSAKEVLRWAESLESLLSNQYGLTVFRHFLRSEFSEENLDFWLAVERFKKTRPSNKMAARAAKIYDHFISTTASRQVNVDSAIREATNQSLRLGVSSASFQLAQEQIFNLMETDSYPRFLKSRLYTQLASHNTEQRIRPTRDEGLI